MATTNIELDIENITGVADANAQFIKTAQKFVVSSIPKDLMLWAGTSTAAATHGGDNSPTAVTLPQPTDSIIDVVRNGFSAEQVPESMQGFIDNSSSLHKATVTFPKYYIQAGNKVVVKPDPTASQTALVNYVDFLKVDDDCDLRGAVVYHACASEYHKLAAAAAPSDFSISAVAPVVPSTPSFTYTDVSVNDIVQPLVSISDMASLSATAPAYTKPNFLQPAQSFDIAQLETFLETEEDIELAQGQLGRLSHELGEYQANIGVQTSKYQNDMSTKNTKLQKDVQIELQNAVQDFQQDVQEYTAKMNRYSSQLSQYQQDVSKEVQEYQNKLGLYSSKLGYYSQKADKYYEMASLQINMYIQNNSKIISSTIAAKAAAQQQRA